MNTTSYWLDTAELPSFPQLQQDLHVDVAILGAGITGITTAYLLKRAGYSVALLERGRCGGFDTPHTTAHLTYVTDTPLRVLVQRFGKERAALAWEAGRAAIQQIASNIADESIRCDFEWVPGYYHSSLAAADGTPVDALKEEAAIADELGFEAEYVASVPIFIGRVSAFLGRLFFIRYDTWLVCFAPWGEQGVMFSRTARRPASKNFPCWFALARTKSFVTILSWPRIVRLSGKSNLLSSTLFQTKQFLYTTYAVGARWPADDTPEACFSGYIQWYHYLRLDKAKGYGYAIFGGEDHKTGQVSDTSSVYRRLEQMRAILPAAEVDHRWSGQVIETSDGLPYIGEIIERQFVGTGFAGNGMTYGTVTGIMAVEAYGQHPGAWFGLFDPHRKVLQVDAAMEYAKENADYPYRMVRDRLTRADSASPESLQATQGAVLHWEGRKVAVYRDAEGKLCAYSAVCPHLGCVVTLERR